MTAEPIEQDRTLEYIARPGQSLEGLGKQLAFAAKALAWSPRTIRRYSRETLRLLTEVCFGTGGLAVIGGTLGVMIGMTLFTGLIVGLQGYSALNQLGTAALTGFISAYFNTREVAPLSAGLALSATVGCGFTAQLGAMRISDEIDALEVMGVPPITFLCASRLLAAWIVLPFVYLVGIVVMYGASYLSVVKQVADVSSGGYTLIFWMFQDPTDVIYSLIKGMAMATVIVLVGCYYGYTARGGPVGVGTATAKSMFLNIILVHIVGMLGTLAFWGANPRAPIGG
jgi:phospholipid/cholesterol/gamma-HCH transport system permease protein